MSDLDLPGEEIWDNDDQYPVGHIRVQVMLEALKQNVLYLEFFIFLYYRELREQPCKPGVFITEPISKPEPAILCGGLPPQRIAGSGF